MKLLGENIKISQNFLQPYINFYRSSGLFNVSQQLKPHITNISEQ
jgi:hypothetical protein